jgi:hypothetical protein
MADLHPDRQKLTLTEAIEAMTEEGAWIRNTRHKSGDQIIRLIENFKGDDSKALVERRVYAAQDYKGANAPIKVDTNYWVVNGWEAINARYVIYTEDEKIEWKRFNAKTT